MTDRWRVRTAALIATVTFAALGLASRTTALRDVPVIGEYGGDAAWAMAAYSLIRFIVPGARQRSVILMAAMVCLAVEMSQLIRWEWLDDLRSNTPLGLLVGRGFLWMDLPVYAVGILVAALGELLLRRLNAAITPSAFPAK